MISTRDALDKMSKINKKYTLQFTLERFEFHIAILRNEYYGEIRWPITQLHPDARVGNKFNIDIQRIEEKNEPFRNEGKTPVQVQNFNQFNPSKFNLSPNQSSPNKDSKYEHMKRLLEELIN